VNTSLPNNVLLWKTRAKANTTGMLPVPVVLWQAKLCTIWP